MNIIKNNDIHNFIFGSSKTINTYNKYVATKVEVFNYFWKKYMFKILSDLRERGDITPNQYKSARGNIFNKECIRPFINKFFGYDLFTRLYGRVDYIASNFIYIKTKKGLYKITEITSTDEDLIYN